MPTKLPSSLAKMQTEIRDVAIDYGLDFFEVIFAILDFDRMNQVAAYGGFPNRYPHWSFGMEYERLKKSYAYGLHRIYEMVINNDPCYAYLLVSNEPVDQKLVMAHVYGHSDFFKNNLWFSHTNRKMMDEMANHGTRIRRYMDKYGEDEVEDFIDICKSIENLIDPHLPGIRRRPRPESEEEEELSADEQRPGELPAKSYMDPFINPPEILADERERRREKQQSRKKRFPTDPERDIMLFLSEHAPLDTWQQDVLAVIREEAYYFLPQRQTKIVNEGWACATGGTLVPTDLGLLRVDKIVNERLPVRVSDGEHQQRVYDWAKFEEQPTIRMITRRGFVLEGSLTHRVRLADGRWKRLDELKPGDQLQVAAHIELWPSELQPIAWEARRRMTLQDVADEVGVDLSTVIRHQQGRFTSRSAEALDIALAAYEEELETLSFMQNKRTEIHVPSFLNADLAEFLGYVIGDGHVSRVKGEVGLTTGDDEQAERFLALGQKLFDIEPSRKRDGNRWRGRLYSQALVDFLISLGLTDGPSASEKRVPPLIMKSPKEVVSAFLRAYFDCDAYAGKYGVILSSASERLSEQTQLLLLQFGILSRRRPQQDGCWHVHITGLSAQRFAEEIGFGLKRKQDALHDYLENRQWFKAESWTDEVATLEPGTATVYDLSVANTHCYAANGLINHNSYWHSTIMTQSGVMTDAEVVDYADHHSGTVATKPGRLNPYKLGLELFRDIEERWNKGRFGPEYEQCEDLQAKANWDRQLGLGREKIFEVRRIYNDVGLIDTFMTEDFARRHRLFTYGYNERRKQFEIESREFEKIKKKLLFSLTNSGDPIIRVQDANYGNRGELLLSHQHEGVDLKLDYARDTLENIYKIWDRPVHIDTIVEDSPQRFSFDGRDHRTRRLS